MDSQWEREDGGWMAKGAEGGRHFFSAAFFLLSFLLSLPAQQGLAGGCGA